MRLSTLERPAAALNSRPALLGVRRAGWGSVRSGGRLLAGVREGFPDVLLGVAIAAGNALKELCVCRNDSPH